jgi:hypothetical protein
MVLRRVYVVGIVGVVTLSGACGKGPASRPPISGADLVANAVSSRYNVVVDGVQPAAGGAYEWTVTAVNGSAYSWKGTLTLKLVDEANRVLESHDVPISTLVPPGGRNEGLKFTSRHRPLDAGGDVAALKVEVNVTEYKEAAGR